ncbi:N-acetyl-gamma-glutamyl-phosphate reductase [Parashewanella spongiae]|uniref:N-acetyl-gamma-glutamyl-phosphate reductase n=1 Tax=Parashewanella spongiae TaxID=342950 RepID=A0A3A6U886_9GAMM|nr:N-acetyl-gamma-glutamyl-phosphate reductase [Parashewanella spongiae]MCL1077077.1 N-acetyl-gamma-glutamyl-phosphate reductase [Parashewanella spongiae]RJY17686.1 N-acetyl-gamma-glutamyl-phosphate reductase [Parashewanella spongiae]
MQNTYLKIAVIGASGYVGAELVELLNQHPLISELQLMVSQSSDASNLCFSDIHPRLKNICDLPFQILSETWIEQNADKLDAVFFATPHDVSVNLAQIFITKKVKVFDLSGGFRLKDASKYPVFYGFEHQQVQLLTNAVYGLAEWQYEAIERSNLIAVPGCYPTASLLALKPLTSNRLHLKNGLIAVNGISGVSGAGRKTNLATSFNEVSLAPYNILQHRHQPEISQEASVEVVFNPHLAPYKRGLLSTVTLNLKSGLTQADVEQVFTQAYQDQPMIRLLGTWPRIDNVAHTPFADIHWQFDDKNQVVVVCCAIDNLLKGAASQAVQCLNITLGLPSQHSLIPEKKGSRND